MDGLNYDLESIIVQKNGDKDFACLCVYLLMQI